MSIITRFGLTIVLFFLFIMAAIAKANTKSSFEQRFLKAKFIEAVGQREVLLVFEVSGTDPKNFPPTIAREVKYTLGNSKEVHTNFIQNAGNVRILSFRNNIREKSPLIYSYIKDKIDLSANKKLMFLAFYVKVPLQEDFDTMTFNYTLIEKRNPKLRTVMKHQVQIEQE